MARGVLYLFAAIGAALAVFVALARAGSYEAEISALVEPSNADIHPLENGMLLWFAGALLLQFGTIVFAFLSGGRLIGGKGKAA